MPVHEVEAVEVVVGERLQDLGDELPEQVFRHGNRAREGVVNRSGRERLSLVLAFDPDPETVIDARAVFGPGVRVEHEPIPCGDYLVRRFAKAFPYRSQTPEGGRAGAAGGGPAG